jgi:hypothetical protein
VNWITPPPAEFTVLISALISGPQSASDGEMPFASAP